jgi:hypothetical protein
VNTKVVRRTLKSRRTARLWAVSFLATLGILEGAISLLTAFFPDQIKADRSWYLPAVVGLSIIVACIQAWPKLKYSRHFLVPDTQISLVVGDLFDQSGHLVIGANDTFDTETPVVINAGSVQGQFLAREYQGDVAALDRDLDAALRGHTVIGQESRRTKPAGKLKRYAMGTVLVLGKVQRRYFCTAYTRMSNACVARSSVEDLWMSLQQLWNVVRDEGQLEPLSMPIIGSGLARLGSRLSHSDLLRLIVVSFMAASREQIVTKHLQIVIHPKDAARLDLKELADVLSSQ